LLVRQDDNELLATVSRETDLKRLKNVPQLGSQFRSLKSKLDPAHRRCVIPYRATECLDEFGAPGPVTYLKMDVDPSAAGYSTTTRAMIPMPHSSGGTYAGPDPDPYIRAALIRELGRQQF